MPGMFYCLRYAILIYLTHFKGVKTTTTDILFCRQWFAQSVTLKAYLKKKHKRDCKKINSLIKNVSYMHLYYFFNFYGY